MYSLIVISFTALSGDTWTTLSITVFKLTQNACWHTVVLTETEQFLWAAEPYDSYANRCPSYHPTNSVKALKGNLKKEIIILLQ